MTLTFLVFLPLAAGLALAFLPRGLTRWFAASAALGVFGYSLALLIDYPASGGGLRYAVDEVWIQELGIHYALGLDGLNLFLVLLTTLLWAIATVWAALRECTKSLILADLREDYRWDVLEALCEEVWWEDVGTSIWLAQSTR